MATPVISRAPLMLDGRTANVRTGHYINEVFRRMPKGVKGMAQMTALINRFTTSTTTLNDPLFYWWDKAWQQRATAITDVFNGPGLTNATTTSVAGDTRIVQVAEAAAKSWIVGQQIRLTKFADSGFLEVSGSVVAVIEGIAINGSSSYLTVRMLQADAGSLLGGTYLKGDPAGQQHHEIHTLPDGKFEDVTRLENACSTMLGAYSLTDFQRKAKMERTGIDPLKEMRADAIKDFLLDKESQFMYGIYDASSPTQYSAGGLEYFVKAFDNSTGTNFINALTNTNYIASTTTGPAYTWIYELLSRLISYLTTYAGDFEGDQALTCFHGPQVSLVLNQMVLDKGVYQLGETTSTDEYGLVVRKLRFQNGEINFREHPMFKLQQATQGRMVLLPPGNIKQATFMPFEEIPSDIMDQAGAARSKRTGSTWSSVGKGGFREVCGWEFNGVESMAIVDNVHTQLDRA